MTEPEPITERQFNEMKVLRTGVYMEIYKHIGLHFYHDLANITCITLNGAVRGHLLQEGDTLTDAYYDK